MAEAAEAEYYTDKKTPFLAPHLLATSEECILSATSFNKWYLPKKTVAIGARVAVVVGTKCVGIVKKRGKKENSRSKLYYVWLENYATQPVLMKNVVALPEEQEFVRHRLLVI